MLLFIYIYICVCIDINTAEFYLKINKEKIVQHVCWFPMEKSLWDRVEILSLSLGEQRMPVRRGEGWVVRQAAACPQDSHKYPCKLQFKINQYTWQVANATIWAVMKVCCQGGQQYSQITAERGQSGLKVQVGWKSTQTHAHTHTWQGQWSACGCQLLLKKKTQPRLSCLST